MSEDIIDPGQKKRIKRIKIYRLPAQKVAPQYFQSEFLEVPGVGGEKVKDRGSPDLKEKDQPYH